VNGVGWVPGREAPTGLREVTSMNRLDHRVQPGHQVGGQRDERSSDIHVVAALRADRRFHSGAHGSAARSVDGGAARTSRAVCVDV
jgi:hypothetical protein